MGHFTFSKFFFIFFYFIFYVKISIKSSCITIEHVSNFEWKYYMLMWWYLVPPDNFSEFSIL